MKRVEDDFALVEANRDVLNMRRHMRDDYKKKAARSNDYAPTEHPGQKLKTNDCERQKCCSSPLTIGSLMMQRDREANS